MREICERYAIPYNSGPLGKQFGTVVRKIFRLALPDRKEAEAAVPAEVRPEAERVPVAA